MKFKKSFPIEYAYQVVPTLTLISFLSDPMSAWNVFLDHWLIEENKAKRKDYFQKIKTKISLPVTRLMLVSVFKCLLRRFERMENREEKGRLSFELQNRAMMLVVIKALDGECEVCRMHCMGFEIEDNHLWKVCQSQGCGFARRMAFFLFE